MNFPARNLHLAVVFFQLAMFDDTSSYNVTEMQRLTASAGIFPLLAFLGDPNSGAPKWTGLLNGNVQLSVVPLAKSTHTQMIQNTSVSPDIFG